MTLASAIQWLIKNLESTSWLLVNSPSLKMAVFLKFVVIKQKAKLIITPFWCKITLKLKT